MMTIRNPVEWSADTFRWAVGAVESTSRALHRDDGDYDRAVPAVRDIELSDLREALIEGWRDYSAYRSDVLFIGLIYPLAGLVLGQMALGSSMLHLLFPLISGFALVGPFLAAGLYEMSRRREQGKAISWIDAFSIFKSPAFAAVIRLGVVLMTIFAFWLLAALWIYRGTLGPEAPQSLGRFVTDVLTTPAGWSMIIAGCGVGFLFALLVLAISAVSFPLLIDRKIRVRTAMLVSVRAFLRNPEIMLIWGLIVAAGLVLGSLPLLAGLIIVMPILGHATWHLYRKVVR